MQGFLLWMLYNGRARHPGRGHHSGTLSYLNIFLCRFFEFIIVGGWSSTSDLALECQAHSLAIAEHRLIPARTRNATTQLRQAGISIVWPLPAKKETLGGHVGVGKVCLHGAPLALPAFAKPSFTEFFRLGRALRGCTSFVWWRCGSTAAPASQFSDRGTSILTPTPSPPSCQFFSKKKHLGWEMGRLGKSVCYRSTN